MNEPELFTCIDMDKLIQNQMSVRQVSEWWQLHNKICIFYGDIHIAWYENIFGIIKFKFGKIDIL